VQKRYQRAQVQDLGSKWKLFYWDYTRTPRQRRTKSWSKSLVPSSREAQRLADEFMQTANERNNQPHLFQSDEETLQAVYNKCRNLTWPHLKNSTRKQYEENFKTYLLPEFGNRKVRKMKTMDLQAYFNTLPPRLSPKSIRLIHGTLRAALNDGRAWGMLDRNPAVGVKLPRKRQVKPTVLLSLEDVRQKAAAAKLGLLRRSISGASGPCTPALCGASALVSRLLVTTWVTPEVREASRSMSIRRRGGTNESRQ
jgi:hypothetical protein